MGSSENDALGAGPRVRYGREPDLSPAEFRCVLEESGLGASRPIDDEPRLAAMLAAADLIVTARLDQPGQPLVGVARCITDFVWTGYLSELAVCASVQRLGIGKGLLEETRRHLGPQVSIVLASYPDAAAFYTRAGMIRWADTFWYRRER